MIFFFHFATEVFDRLSQVKITVKDMEGYHQFLNDKLTYLDHIGSAHSTFIINEVKNTHTIEFA